MRLLKIIQCLQIHDVYWQDASKTDWTQFYFKTNKQKNVYGDSPRKVDTKSVSPGFPGGAVVENPSAYVGDTCLSPCPGISHMLRSN